MLHLSDTQSSIQQAEREQLPPEYTEYTEYSQPYQPQSGGTMASPPAETPPPVTPGTVAAQNGPARPSRGWRTAAIVIMSVVLLLVFGVGLFSGWVYSRGTATPASSSSSTASSSASSTSVSSVQAAQEAVSQKVSPSIVEITVQTAQGTAIGSGVILDTSGYIVTNAHVVSGAQDIQVTLYDGTKIDNAQLVGTSAANDLAVIKIDTSAKLSAATLGNSSQLKVGEDVLAIGNPLGITQTVTNGIISALNRDVSESQSSATIHNAIQTDAPINPGNSGGALVDLQGNVIGILTLSAIDPEFNTPASGVGFAIPSNSVQAVANQIIQAAR